MVSSKDIAKKAFVSQSTVSRVINNPETVSISKRKKVEKVMKELNFIPDSVARSLVKNKTNQITLISGTLNNPFFVESTRIIVKYAYQQGYTVNVFFEEDFNKDYLYDKAFSQKTDGIILSSMYYESEHIERLFQINVPYIMFNRKHIKGGNFVEINNKEAGFKGVKYLTSKGHKDIHFFSGELNKSTFLGRYLGFCKGMRQFHKVSEEENISITEQTPESIETELIKVLSSKKKVTAIFAATDMIALTIINYLHRLNYEIPKDIAIMGIDNTEALSHNSFSLTSIGPANNHLSFIAIKHLFDQINENEKDKHTIQKTIPCKIYNRKTV